MCVLPGRKPRANHAPSPPVTLVRVGDLGASKPTLNPPAPWEVYLPSSCLAASIPNLGTLGRCLTPRSNKHRRLLGILLFPCIQSRVYVALVVFVSNKSLTCHLINLTTIALGPPFVTISSFPLLIAAISRRLRWSDQSMHRMPTCSPARLLFRPNSTAIPLDNSTNPSSSDFTHRERPVKWAASRNSRPAATLDST